MPTNVYNLSQETRRRQADVRHRQERDIDAHVEALKAIRGEIEGKLGEFQRTCESLRRAVRLNASDDSSAKYRSYVLSQSRLGGALQQAVKRAMSMDRLLEIAKAERNESAQVLELNRQRRESRHAEKRAFDLQLPREDDFETLYGEVTDAP